MEKSGHVAWLTLWLAIGIALLTFSDRFATQLSTHTPWRKDDLTQVISWAGGTLVILTIVLAAAQLILPRLPGFVVSLYKFQVTSAKLLLTPIVRLLSAASNFAVGWFRRFLTMIIGIWANLIRRLTLALLRSVGVQPDNFHRWAAGIDKEIVGLEGRVSKLEAMPMLDELSLNVLRILHKERPDGSLQIRLKNKLSAEGLSEHELAQMLRLSDEEIIRLRSSIRRLVVLNLIDPIWVRDKVTWWEAPQGSTFLLTLKYINQ
jgi:hypothetical protein